MSFFKAHYGHAAGNKGHFSLKINELKSNSPIILGKPKQPGYASLTNRIT